VTIANQVKALTEDIEASYGTRIAAVSDIAKETHQTLGSFHRAHQKMANELQDSLSISERERMKDFAILIGDVKATVESIEKDTANLLSNFAQEHKEMAQKLAEFLSSSEKGRLEEFAILIGDVKATVEAIKEATAETRAENVKDLKEMAQEVKEFLSEVANDLRQARTHWQNLAKVMAAKRAGKSIPSPKAAETFENGELKDRVLKVVQAHPGGIKLSKIGKTLKIAYIQAAKPIKDLLAEVKITKRNSKYLPA